MSDVPLVVNLAFGFDDKWSEMENTLALSLFALSPVNDLTGEKGTEALRLVIEAMGLPEVGAEVTDPLIEGVCEVRGYVLWPSGFWMLLDSAAGEVIRTPAEARALTVIPKEAERHAATDDCKASL